MTGRSACSTAGSAVSPWPGRSWICSPDENLVYVGDTGRYPYGPRPLAEVRHFARQITAKLVDEHDVKMVVVACNTAAAAGLESRSGSWPTSRS